jgi:hypothetical protein
MTTDNKINKCNEYLCSDYALDSEWREMINEYRNLLIAKYSDRLFILPEPMKVKNIISINWSHEVVHK